MSLLEVRAINSYYGSSHVLHDLSLAVDDDQLVVLIGRNGAGKSTTLKSIMGIVTPRSGSVVFDGEDITGYEPHATSQRGIAIIPEKRDLFPQLTVRENLRVGYLGHDVEEEEDELFTPIFEYFPRLEERQDQEAGSLSGGEQQMLAIGRGLVSDPDFLLVDEPTEGLMPTLVEKLEDILRQINDDGLPILLVEQNVNMALELADYVYVIDEGMIQTEGPTDKLLEDQEVIEKYLTV